VVFILVDEPSTTVFQNKVYSTFFAVKDDIEQFGDVLMAHFLENGHFVADEHACQ
jgi:hypothetical protein